MKVTPVAGPQAVQQTTSNNTDAKARAIAAFNNANQPAPAQVQAQETAVQNPNQVFPEEMSAIKAPTLEVEPQVETSPEAETKPEVKPEAKDPVLTKQFTELARQERILRAKAQKQAQEIKAEREAIAAEKAVLEAKIKEYETGYVPRSRIKTDPLSVLAEESVSYDEITQQLLNQQPRDPRVEARIAAIENENKALRQQLEKTEQSQKQQQQDAYQQALKQIERDTLSLIKSEPETYEAIAKTKSHKDVVELIEETWKKDGIVLSVEEAAQEVENYLVEEGVNTFSQISKIKQRIAQSGASTAPAKPSQKTEAVQKQTQPAPMKTLTNAASSTRKLSSRERAILAFKGELKS